MPRSMISIMALTVFVAVSAYGFSKVATCESMPNETKSVSDLSSIPFVFYQDLPGNKIAASINLPMGKVIIGTDGKIMYCLSAPEKLNAYIIEEQFEGSKPCNITGEAEGAPRVSIFEGNNPSEWARNLPAYDILNLGEVYNGISVKLKATGNNFEKLFYVSPGADPRLIKIGLKGSSGLAIDRKGKLVVSVQADEVSFTRPVAYQQINGQVIPVEVSYIIYDWNHYGFRLGQYDRSRELIIDPLLASTYLGGSNQEGWQYSGGMDIARDGDGNIFVVGRTRSYDFPITPGTYEYSNLGSGDYFVSKFDKDLKTLLASTFIGGYGVDDYPSICIDGANNVYICGYTTSSNYPVTTSAFDRTWNGAEDIVISKFNNNLTELLGSTYLGGNSSDYSPEMIIAPDGNIIVAGNTASGTNFPRTAGVVQYDFGGNADYFITIMNPDLTSIVASTFLGGQDDEVWFDIALDPDGNIILAGSTKSPDYPTTPGCYDNTYNGLPGDFNHDVVISKLNANLTALLASTYFGGSNFESGSIAAVDPDGNIFFGGHTDWPDFPTTPGVYDEQHNGTNEFYISKFDNNLTTLLASTFLTPLIPDDGSGFGYFVDMKCDDSGNVIIVGNAFDTIFETTSRAFDRTFNGSPSDGALRILSNDLTELRYSTFFGTDGEDQMHKFIRSENGEIYFLGTTNSPNIPIIDSSAAYDYQYAGNVDIFIGKLSFYFKCGDANRDTRINLLDVSYIINSLYRGGRRPDPIQSADVNNDGRMNLLDVSYIISFLYRQGPAPNCP
jgi:hypothetical protein